MSPDAPPMAPSTQAARQVLVHAPYGEPNLVGGGYVSTTIGSGKAQRYTERNWGRRWMVEGVGSGWWLELGGGETPRWVEDGAKA